MKPLAYLDYTIKAKLDSTERVEILLKSLHATLVGLDIQTDTYFETSKGKLKLRQGTIENLITHYERIVEDGFERTIVYRYDVNPTDKKLPCLRINKL
jgi:adenylate cyclase, class 2